MVMKLPQNIGRKIFYTVVDITAGVAGTEVATSGPAGDGFVGNMIDVADPDVAWDMKDAGDVLMRNYSEDTIWNNMAKVAGGAVIVETPKIGRAIGGAIVKLIRGFVK